MKTGRWTGYIIYGILITVIFLYVHFPSDNTANYIKSIVVAGNPNVVLSFDSANPCFPPGIKLGNIEIGFRNRPDLILKMDALKIRPAIASLLSGKLSLLLYADAYEGDMRTNINFANRFSTEGPVRVNTGFSGINLGKCSCLKVATGRRIDGMLSGSLSYNGRWDRITSGTGSARLTLLGGSVQLLRDIFSLGELDFDKVETDITLKKRTLKITSLEMTGKQLNGSFSGNIFLNENIMRSRLAIKGNIKIHAMNRELSTALNGTIANPIPRFM
ncbi:MAG: type II secretion system protein GspN [Syntrophobacterales bacterium]|nr:type II secretion system protein GspN [Syntrophobacterales bacterium]